MYKMSKQKQIRLIPLNRGLLLVTLLLMHGTLSQMLLWQPHHSTILQIVCTVLIL